MTTYICQEKRKIFQNFVKKYLSSCSKYHSVVFIYEIVSGNNFPNHFNNKANNNINKNKRDIKWFTDNCGKNCV